IVSVGDLSSSFDIRREMPNLMNPDNSRQLVQSVVVTSNLELLVIRIFSVVSHLENLLIQAFVIGVDGTAFAGRYDFSRKKRKTGCDPERTSRTIEKSRSMRMGCVFN